MPKPSWKGSGKPAIESFIFKKAPKDKPVGGVAAGHYQKAARRKLQKDF